MGQKKAVVEIIPWIHDPRYLQHADIIKYIRALPKNSGLSLEITPAVLAAAGKVEALLIGRKPNTRGLGRDDKLLIKELSGALPMQVFDRLPISSLAVNEVINECRKRNISITPLETPVSSAKGGGGHRFGATPLEEKDARGRYREAAFARQIRARLWKFSGEKFPAIVGEFHVSGLKGALDKIGVASTVNTNIFTQRRVVEDKLKLLAKIRKAARAGRQDEVDRLERALQPRWAEGLPRAEPYFAVVSKIARDLAAKAARPAIKLAERKQKQAARLAKRQRRK